MKNLQKKMKKKFKKTEKFSKNVKMQKCKNF